MMDPVGLAGALTPDGGHRLLQRVYYEDTDAGGIVYHARYLHFLERGRTDYLRLMGIDQRVLMAEAGLAFVVRHMVVDFHAPARLDDIVMVTTSPVVIGGASLELDQAVMREGRALVTARVKIACIDREGRPRRLPPQLRSALSGKA